MKINEAVKQYWKALQQDTHAKILLSILVLSFVLRVWGIWNIEQTDEFNEVFEALKVDSGSLNLDRWNKKVLIYILAVEYALYFGMGWLFGIFSSVSDFASKIAVDMAPLFIIGRVTSAIFGTAIVFITYLVGKRLFDKEAGLYAAIFLCFNFVHVEHSHLVLVDITMTLFVMLSFYFAVCMMYQGTKKEYFLAGLFAGIAIVAKVPAIFILISVGIAHAIVSYEKSGNLKNIVFDGKVIFIILGIIAGGILGNPAILLAFPKYLEWLRSLLGAYQGTVDQIAYWTPVNGFVFYLKTLSRNLGLPLLGLTIAGLLYFIARPRREILLLLSFILPFYFFMANSKWVLADRYMIPIFPFLSVIAGGFLYEIKARMKIRKFVMAVTLVILLIIPLKSVSIFEISLLQKNTRYWAKEWIESNIPKGSKILIDSGRTINTQSPPLFNNRENIIAIMNKIENLEEGETFDDSRIVDFRSAVYFKYMLNNLPSVTYDLTSTELGKKVKNIKYYRENGYDYIVTSSDITWLAENEKWANTYPESAMFYKSLKKEFKIVKDFNPGVTRSGPRIVIYKVE